MPTDFYYTAYGHYDTADVANIFVSKFLADTTPMWIQPDLKLTPLMTDSYFYHGIAIHTHSPRRKRAHETQRHHAVL